MKTTALTSICVVITLFFSDCSSPKGEQAAVGEALDSVPVVEPGEPYTVDNRQSIVTWIGTKPTGQHNGIIPLSNGTILVSKDQKKITGGTLIIEVQALQVMDLRKGTEDHTKLTNHLLSEDFFHTAAYPTATFEIVEVIPIDSTMTFESPAEYKGKYTPATMQEFMVSDPTHKISGNLTMRGVTRGISFPAAISIDGDQLKAGAKFNINRTDWNLSYQDESTVADKARDSFIYNTVNVGFSLLAGKED